MRSGGRPRSPISRSTTRLVIAASARPCGAGIQSRCPSAGSGLALANVCILGPGGVGDDGKAQTWAEDLMASLSSERAELKHTALNLLGIILYRSGRFRAAIDRINEGIAVENGEISLDDAAVLAMAYHESGDQAKAGEMLAEDDGEPAQRLGDEISGTPRPTACSAARPNSSSSIAPSRSIRSRVEGSRRKELQSKERGLTRRDVRPTGIARGHSGREFGKTCWWMSSFVPGTPCSSSWHDNESSWNP